VGPHSKHASSQSSGEYGAKFDQYIAAFENADAAARERLLLAEATLEATPLRTWFAGRSACVPFLRDHLLGSHGDWRMLATSANGQRAAAAFIRDPRGNYQSYGICVLTVTGAGIRRISSFGDPRGLQRRRADRTDPCRGRRDRFSQDRVGGDTSASAATPITAEASKLVGAISSDMDPAARQFAGEAGDHAAGQPQPRGRVRVLHYQPRHHRDGHGPGSETRTASATQLFP
jgi:hypothetical protein